MNDMVERVALALWLDEFPDCIWESCPERTREDYRGHARAAIEAMREPTEGMLNASRAAAEFIVVGQEYREMIEAALSE